MKSSIELESSRELELRKSEEKEEEEGNKVIPKSAIQAHSQLC